MPCGSKTSFVPSQQALLLNSAQSSLISRSLYFGSEVIERHALNNSTFWSLFSVFGRFLLIEQAIIEPKASSVDLNKDGDCGDANGDGPSLMMRSSSSLLVLGHLPVLLPDGVATSESEEELAPVALNMLPGDDDEEVAASDGDRDLLPLACDIGLSEDGGGLVRSAL